MRRPLGHDDDNNFTGKTDLIAKEIWNYETPVSTFTINGNTLDRKELNRPSKSFLSIFVPDGYPVTVREGYAAFQLFDSIQGLCSYLRGVLSTQAILEGFGVGSENANALAATTQWVYRDGAGMVGGLVFAWFGEFDLNVKRWRLFADFAVDCALTLELASKIICVDSRYCFTATVCTASVLKALCGVAANSTRAVITAHFARGANIADVQAKEGSQETFVSLIGMVSGLWLAHTVEHYKAHWWIPWGVFLVLTWIHLLCNYFAVRALRFPTLNEPRLSVILELMESGNHDIHVSRVNALENILSKPKYTFRIGCKSPPATSVIKHCASSKVCCISTPGSQSMAFVLHEKATFRDIIANIYVAALQPKAGLDAGFDFVNTLESQGWNCNTLLLKDDKYRLKYLD